MAAIWPLLTLVLTLGAGAEPDGSKIAPDVPRRVLAFYYAWYGTPEQSGRWRHWEGVDPEQREIASSTNYPALGAYDSSDPAVIDLHMRQMVDAGIDGPVVSWWGPSAPDSDRVMPAILEAAARHGRVVSAYLETIRSEDDRVGSAAEDLSYLIRNYAAHPTWLKVDGRPVVFLYIRVLDQLGPLERWSEVRGRVQEATGIDPFLIGDAVSPAAAEVFDGLHRYNTAGLLRDRPLAEIRDRLAALAGLDAAVARSRDRLACFTVIPGYDDTKIRTPGLAIPRHHGATYAAGWAAATAAPIDWALITSWNEWHEGSEIEPSIELGDRELKATPRHVREFKTARRPEGAASAAPGWQAFAEGWRGGAVGLLEGVGIETAGGELARSGLPLRIVSLRELCAGTITARDCPTLIYVGGERFRSDPGDRWTLPEALNRFARDGGVLIVASPEAWPFYRDEATGRTAWSPEIGLPLRQGFERPPVQGLRFTFTGPLANLGTRPYPSEGEQRFRPCAPPSGAVQFEPMATLTGPEGQDFGIAVASLVYDEGPLAPARLIYVAAPVWNAVDAGTLLRTVLERAESLRRGGPRD